MNAYLDTIWVCTDCLVHDVNGPQDNYPHGNYAPWNRLDKGVRATPGLLTRFHADDCPGDSDSCGCEQRTFSKSDCEACGQMLHGRRHAYTVWAA